MIDDNPARCAPPDTLDGDRPFRDPHDIEPEREPPSVADLLLNAAISTAVGTLALDSLEKYSTMISSRTSARDILALLNDAVRAGVAVGQKAAAQSERSLLLPLLCAAVRYLIANVHVPDSNCSCHISPPCHDCIEYGALRQSLADTDVLLSKFES